MADEPKAPPIMFRIWVRNETTKESAQFLGQGNSIPEAFKDGWDNANEDFGKSSSGAPPIARAHVGVVLPDGRKVFRRPSAFASRKPYEDAEGKEFEHPTCRGDAAKTHAELVEEGRETYNQPRPRKEGSR